MSEKFSYVLNLVLIAVLSLFIIFTINLTNNAKIQVADLEAQQQEEKIITNLTKENFYYSRLYNSQSEDYTLRFHGTNLEDLRISFVYEGQMAIITDKGMNTIYIPTTVTKEDNNLVIEFDFSRNGESEGSVILNYDIEADKLTYEETKTLQGLGDYLKFITRALEVEVDTEVSEEV